VVEADPVLLEQVLQNLISNALQYRRAGEAPVVEVSVERSGAMWQFTVKDNGEGILPHHQHGVFEPLKRLHGNETPGTGLGLVLCRTVVGRHGGRIWVESDGSGRGAIFRFNLEAAQESRAIVWPEEPAIGTAAASKRERSQAGKGENRT
jgi:two-component system, chemotaxis family, sensor kinase Cph1